MSLYICRVWGYGLREEYICIFTRVLEKTAKFALLLKQVVLQRLKDDGRLKQWMEVKNYSDCGPHFRANRVLAHSMIKLPELFGIHMSHVFALECHGKSNIDS